MSISTSWPFSPTRDFLYKFWCNNQSEQLLFLLVYNLKIVIVMLFPSESGVVPSGKMVTLRSWCPGSVRLMTRKRRDKREERKRLSVSEKIEYSEGRGSVIKPRMRFTEIHISTFQFVISLIARIPIIMYIWTYLHCRHHRYSLLRRFFASERFYYFYRSLSIILPFIMLTRFSNSIIGANRLGNYEKKRQYRTYWPSSFFFRHILRARLLKMMLF